MSPIKELRLVDVALREYPVPEDVLIGSNRAADKVTWLIMRLKATERSLQTFRDLWDESHFSNKPKGFLQ